MKKIIYALLSLCLASPLVATQVRTPAGCSQVTDGYVVVLKNIIASSATPASRAQQLTQTYGGTVDYVYENVFEGFSMSATSGQAQGMAGDSGVDFVEQDCYGNLTSVQSPAPWGLDRSDQRDLPLSDSYSYGSDGSNVDVYVLDSGIKATHPDFGTRVIQGYNALTQTVGGQTDPRGHGTHVAGIIGGTTYGMAKGVTMIPVVITDSTGKPFSSALIKGIDWTIDRYNSGTRPAVINLSSSYIRADTIDEAVQEAIDQGIIFVAGAGNIARNACSYSPTSVDDVIVVGGTQSDDDNYFVGGNEGSNYGPCVDLFAPAVLVPSVCPWGTPTCDGSACVKTGHDIALCTGTSFSGPHVAGVAARYLEENSSASPATVEQAIVDNASQNKISGELFLPPYSDPGNASPNKLLYSDFLNQPPTPQDDYFLTSFDTSFTIDKEDDLVGDGTNNDTDPENEAVSFCGFSQPEFGTLTDNGLQGTLTYSPPPGCEIGDDSFTYLVCDVNGYESEGTALIEIAGIICNPNQ